MPCHLKKDLCLLLLLLISTYHVAGYAGSSHYGRVFCSYTNSKPSCFLKHHVMYDLRVAGL